MSETSQKVKQQAAALRRLANTDWGYDKETLRSTFITAGRSMIEHAAPAWTPWISTSGMERLEASQRYAGRAITGQVRTTPKEAILAEANLPTIATRVEQLNTISLEKLYRLSESNPRQMLAERDTVQRTKKQGWRIKGKARWSAIFGKNKPQHLPGLHHHG